MRVVLRCEWICSDVVFECSGFNVIFRLRNFFKDYLGYRNCFFFRIRDIFFYKISVFNFLIGRKYMFIFVDILNASDVGEE